MVTMQDEMNRMFDRFFGRDVSEDQEHYGSIQWHPNVDVSENNDEYLVLAELPGMRKEEIHVTYADGNLKIEGERKQEKEEKDTNYHRVERVYGKFCRNFNIPSAIKNDKISADFKDGVLKIHLPKAEEVKPKQIEVKLS
jgi:HSP20 family protein